MNLTWLDVAVVAVVCFTLLIVVSLVTSAVRDVRVARWSSQDRPADGRAPSLPAAVSGARNGHPANGAFTDRIGPPSQRAKGGATD